MNVHIKLINNSGVVVIVRQEYRDTVFSYLTIEEAKELRKQLKVAIKNVKGI